MTSANGAEQARRLLDELITFHGETYAQISAILGRNAAYIQQYIKRGSPRVLSAFDQKRLAEYFNRPRDFLSADETTTIDSQKLVAILQIRKAIETCEKLGFGQAACHIQLGLDLIERDHCR